MTATLPADVDAGFLAFQLVDAFIDYMIEQNRFTSDERHAMLRLLASRLRGKDALDERCGPAAEFVRVGMLGE